MEKCNHCGRLFEQMAYLKIVARTPMYILEMWRTGAALGQYCSLQCANAETTATAEEAAAMVETMHRLGARGACGATTVAVWDRCYAIYPAPMPVTDEEQAWLEAHK